MMAMAMLVQGYLGISDAEMIELTVVDLRVQMVLGCLGYEAPAFSQGALQRFRDRLIAANLDRRVRERTVDAAFFSFRPRASTLLPTAELSPRTFWSFRRELSSVRPTVRIGGARNALEELSGLSEWPMIIPRRPRGARSSATTTGFGISSEAPGT
jgi:hypothetical protein